MRDAPEGRLMLQPPHVWGDSFEDCSTHFLPGRFPVGWRPSGLCGDQLSNTPFIDFSSFLPPTLVSWESLRQKPARDQLLVSDFAPKRTRRR